MHLDMGRYRCMNKYLSSKSLTIDKIYICTCIIDYRNINSLKYFQHENIYILIWLFWMWCLNKWIYCFTVWSQDLRSKTPTWHRHSSRARVAMKIHRETSQSLVGSWSSEDGQRYSLISKANISYRYTFRELTYPIKIAFWRWFSFSQGGIC